MKQKTFQITCRCAAYKFPHRLGGGRCDGSNWCEMYQIFYGSDCKNCSIKSDGQCDVVTGRESLTQCPAYEYHMVTEQVISLPINLCDKYDYSNEPY